MAKKVRLYPQIFVHFTPFSSISFFEFFGRGKNGKKSKAIYPQIFVHFFKKGKNGKKVWLYPQLFVHF